VGIICRLSSGKKKPGFHRAMLSAYDDHPRIATTDPQAGFQNSKILQIRRVAFPISSQKLCAPIAALNSDLRLIAHTFT
jgi:hypothetical protein